MTSSTQVSVQRNFYKKVPEVLEWPSNSPDINPIKNLWSIVMHNVEKQFPRNIDELNQYIVEEF